MIDFLSGLTRNTFFLGMAGAFIYEFMKGYREKERILPIIITSWSTSSGRICLLLSSLWIMIYVLIGGFISNLIVSEISNPVNYPIRLFSLSTGLSLDVVIRSLAGLSDKILHILFLNEKHEKEKSSILYKTKQWGERTEEMLGQRRILQNQMNISVGTFADEALLSKLAFEGILFKLDPYSTTFHFSESIKSEKQLSDLLNEIGIGNNEAQLIIDEWHKSQSRRI